MSRLALVALTACSGASHPGPTVANRDARVAPSFRFLVQNQAGDVTIIHTANGTIVVEKTIPNAPSYLVWAGTEVVGIHYEEAMPFALHLVGDKFVPLPEIAWPKLSAPPDAPRPGDAMKTFHSDHRLIFATCAWRQEDGYEAVGQCVKWQYARLWPGPVAVLPNAPTPDPARQPPMATGATVHATIEPGREGDDVPAAEHLEHGVCTDAHGKRTIEQSEPGAPALTWFVSDPPIFRFELTSGSGFGPGYTTMAMYEGCTKSERFTDAFVGPQDEVVLIGSELAIYWHGTLVAHAPIAATALAFQTD
jgi:hypothetical protein